MPYRVRVRGGWRQTDVDRWLSEWDCREYRLDGQVLELTTDASNKIPLLRHLLAQKGVTDLELESPNLERLYRYYSNSLGPVDA